MSIHEAAARAAGRAVGAFTDEVPGPAGDDEVPPLADDGTPEPGPTLPPPVEGETLDCDVVTALARARRDMGVVGKRDRFDSPQTKYQYRGVDRVVNASREVLTRHGILLVPQAVQYEGRDVPRQQGGRSHESTVTMLYWVYGPDGDCLEHPVKVIGQALDTSDKDAAKAQSVAWRTALIQLLHIATGDPDPDSVRIDRGEAPEFDPAAYRDEALTPDTSVGRLSQMINDLRNLGKGDVLVVNETGDEEKIGNLIWRVRKDRAGGVV
jgi:hypothetical protein